MELCDRQWLDAMKPRHKEPHELRGLQKDQPNPNFYDTGTKMVRMTTKSEHTKELKHGRK
jgi:hypothetical protein